MTEELSRTSALASRHTALGSGLEDWNGMGTAWTYNSNPEDEHDAVRERAGLFDMSPLKKVVINGKDAVAVINETITRDAGKIMAGQSAYSAVLTDAGTVCDDAIIANYGDDKWLFAHGSGESMARLQTSATGKNVSLMLDDDLHDISLQGPLSPTLLDKHSSINIKELQYFHHQEAMLFGHPCQISRTGYSGERGYEIFATANIIGTLWDNILTEGEKDGVIPCSFTALDKVRIEAGLLFFGYDMTADHTPWEVGLGFTINTNKADFRGKDACLANKGKETFLGVGLVIDHDDMVAGGEILHYNGEEVGIINSPCYSHRMKKSLALGHVKPNSAKPGTILEAIDEEGTKYQVKTASLPFYDPEKSKTHI